VTNDPESARAFIDAKAHGTIYKASRRPERAWRRRLLRPEERGQLDAVPIRSGDLPGAYPRDIDLRVTMVGDESSG